MACGPSQNQPFSRNSYFSFCFLFSPGPVQSERWAVVGRYVVPPMAGLFDFYFSLFFS